MIPAAVLSGFRGGSAMMQSVVSYEQAYARENGNPSLMVCEVDEEARHQPEPMNLGNRG